MLQRSSIIRLTAVSKDDRDLVGSKAVQLGELIRAGFLVPDGFVIPSSSYFQFLKENHLQRDITQLLKTVNFQHPESVMQVSAHIKKRIVQGKMPETVIRDISTAYEKLSGLLTNTTVTLSPSPAIDDLLRPSFYGSMEPTLPVAGEANLFLSIRNIWASLFTPQTLLYRNQHHLDHFRAGVGIIAQKMIQSEKSGLLYTADPVTYDKSLLLIDAFYGWMHVVSKAHVLPDHYEVSKKHLIVLKQEIVRQDQMMVREKNVEKIVNLTNKKSSEPKLSPEQIQRLAELGNRLEKHAYFPQEVQWAIEKNKIYILKTQNLTTLSSSDKIFSKHLLLLLRGKPLSPHLAIGPVKIVADKKDDDKIIQGDVVVVPSLFMEYETLLKKASAIISESSVHEFYETKNIHVPIIVGAENATKLLKPGMIVTVDGIKGEIYKGSHFSTSSHALRLHQSTLKTKTKILTHLTHLSESIDTIKEGSEGLFILQSSKKDSNSYTPVNDVVKRLSQISEVYKPTPVFYQLAPISDVVEFERDITAIKTLREKKKITNLSILLSSLTTEKQMIELKNMLNELGLHRSSLLQQWMMVDTPAQCILFDSLSAHGIDGALINIEALTQHILGTGQQNKEELDELHPSVIWSLEQILKTTRHSNISSCILFVSSFIRTSFLERVVRMGVTSVSVAANNKNLVRNVLHEAEKDI